MSQYDILSAAIESTLSDNVLILPSDHRVLEHSILDFINTHIIDLGNPHQVTAAQVGLGNVPNIDATLRSNHVGTQSISSISDFNIVAPGNGQTFIYNSTSGKWENSTGSFVSQADVTGTNGTIAKFTGTHTVGNSSITDNGTIVSVPVEIDTNWIKFLTGINMDTNPSTFYNRIQRFNDSGLNADGIELEIRGAFNHINGGFRIKTGSNDVTVAPSTSFSIVQNTIRLGALDLYTSGLKGNTSANFQVYINTSAANVDEVAAFVTNSVTKPMILYFNNVGDSPSPRYNSAIVSQYGGRFYDGTLSIFNQPNGTQGKTNMKRTIMFDRDNNVGIGLAYSDAPTLQYPTEYAQAKLHVKSNQTGIPTTIIQMVSGQTADMMQWLDSSNAVILRIKSNGVMNGANMTQTVIAAISVPVEGDDVYNTTTHRRNYYNGTIWRDYSEVPTTEVLTTTQQMAINNRYIANNASLVTCPLPVTAAVGDVVYMIGKGAGLWRISQNSGQTIHAATDTTAGTSGYIQAQSARDCVELRCTTANTDWTLINVRGALTIN